MTPIAFDVTPAIAELRRRVIELEAAIATLSREFGGNGAGAGAGVRRTYKYRQRCQKCEQLTLTDPCGHCGSDIRPAGAKDR